MRRGDRFRPARSGQPWDAAAPARPLRRPRWHETLWGVPALAFLIVMLAGAAVLRADWPLLGSRALEISAALAEAAAPRRFAECSNGRTPTCVVDGDTFRLDGEIIRIADIDTPEVRDYRCASEKARGDRATRRLVGLLNAGPFELRRIERNRDQYGRSLRIVVRDGRSLGGVLVDEGLARRWDGARRGWC